MKKTVATVVGAMKQAPVRKMEQKPINHIVFAVDASGSMYSHANKVPDVFDAQIKSLAKVSQEMDQETRVTVYLFDHETKCLVYDTDVLRLPSLKGHYGAGGGTALIDTTLKAIADLKLTPEIYGDHAFLMYVLTDGQDEHSKKKARDLSQAIGGLPENWTFAALVPDQHGINAATSFGFPKDNIIVWDTKSATGIQDVGKSMDTSIRSYMQGRSTGTRGSKNLFKINANVSANQIRGKLEKLKASEYMILNVRKDQPVKEFVESWTKEDYRQGSAYYQLMKRETVQPNKNILIRDQKNGNVYEGSAARQMLGLPDFEVKVEPAALNGFTIYIQSNSSNRKLIGGTDLIVLK